MAVDVVTEIEIRRPRGEVSAFAADPTNATAWYKGSSGRSDESRRARLLDGPPRGYAAGMTSLRSDGSG